MKKRQGSFFLNLFLTLGGVQGSRNEAQHVKKCGPNFDVFPVCIWGRNVGDPGAKIDPKSGQLLVK